MPARRRWSNLGWQRSAAAWGSARAAVAVISAVSVVSVVTPLAAVAAGAAAGLVAAVVPAVSAAPIAQEVERERAPDWSAAQAWLNTESPLKLADVRGQIVLLAFWAYGRVDAMQAWTELDELAAEFREAPLVIVGVHTGRFAQERDANGVRHALQRLGVSQPVAVDSTGEIQRAYEVRSWPTFVLIDPDGRIVGRVAGVENRAVLAAAIAAELQRGRAADALRPPMRFRAGAAERPGGALRYPGAVLADEAGGRLFISDTGRHRILVTDLAGRGRHVIGTGVPGLTDGPFDRAQFRSPHGLELSADGRTLYVADTGNHTLRTVDLDEQTVLRAPELGTPTTPGGAGVAVALGVRRAPWDLVRVDERLVVTLAGLHQLWELDLRTRSVSVLAGTGREGRIDGPNRGAAFAQPAGLATDGRTLYVADSEGAAIRSVALGPSGETSTLAGAGEPFECGDADGVGAAARFQHPRGLALRGATLYAADTFNHRIRTVDVRTGEVRTWLAADAESPLARLDPPGLSEPGGLSLAGDRLYIVDTNHHRIVVVELASRKAQVLDVRPAAE